MCVCVCERVMSVMCDRVVCVRRAAKGLPRPRSWRDVRHSVRAPQGALAHRPCCHTSFGTTRRPQAHASASGHPGPPAKEVTGDRHEVEHCCFDGRQWHKTLSNKQFVEQRCVQQTCLWDRVMCQQVVSLWRL